jgi:Polyketide cyclase / dehydrase and lipid transport
MVSFRITREIRAPPSFVVHWWLDYSPGDTQLDPGMVQRTVERIDADRVHLTTTTEFGGRLRTTEGTVTRTGPTTWLMTGHVISGGVVVSTLQSSYRVEPLADGSRLQAEFEFRGCTLPWKIALAVSGFSLRRRQTKTFRDYVLAIEAEFDASRGSSSAEPPGRPPPPSSLPPS